jgi:glycoside/pentoside/hexuronide:cation symporter, GPH family
MSQCVTASANLSLVRRIRHGFLAIPLTFAGLPIYMHAPDFYALEFNISLATIGLVLLALRSFDAVQDPVIGALSDRYFNYRREIACVGGLLLAGGFWLLFNPHAQFSAQGYALIWLSMSVVICTTGFSILSINLQAAGALWPVAPQARTLIAATREALGLLGLLMAAVVPAVLFNYFPRREAFYWLSIGYVPLLALGLWVFLRWLQQTPLLAPECEGDLSLRALFNSPWINRFLLIYTLSTFAAAIPGILVIFFVRDYLQLESYTGLFLILYFVSGVLAMPLWQKLAGKIGKNSAWAVSMLLACSAFIGAFFLGAQALIAFSLVCIFSGMALGADLALPQAIMADQVALQPAAASRYCALMAFLSKAALALATGIVLPLVGLLGFAPGSLENNHVLPYAYALIPCCIKLACACFLLYCTRSFYPVSSTSVKTAGVITGI